MSVFERKEGEAEEKGRERRGMEGEWEEKGDSWNKKYQSMNCNVSFLFIYLFFYIFKKFD